MRATRFRAFACLTAIGLVAVRAIETAAQVPANSLGGYGAASPYVNPAPSASGSLVIPYSGMSEGFMPGRMGGGASLGFRDRESNSMSSMRPSFSLSPLNLSPMSGGMGIKDMGQPRPPSTLFGRYGGMGFGTGRGKSSASGGMGVMPRSLGYPFRQPPSLVPSSNARPGMSM